MTLKDLLAVRMKEGRYRPSDLANFLKRSRAAVSLALNKDIEQIRVSTLRSYLEATGLQVDFTKLINNQ